MGKEMAMEGYVPEVMARMPLAEAVLTISRWIADKEHLKSEWHCRVFLLVQAPPRAGRISLILPPAWVH